jgi:hypothetical protein
MNERRKFPRTSLPQKAKFFGKNGWEDCLITEVSRKGIGVKFYTRDKIVKGSIMHLKVTVPHEPNPVMVKGLLRWLEEENDHFVGGIEWYQIERAKKKPV